MEVIVNAAFSFSISVGILVLGLWVAASTITVGSPLGWMLLGLLTVVVGTISLYEAICDVKIA